MWAHAFIVAYAFGAVMFILESSKTTNCWMKAIDIFMAVLNLIALSYYCSMTLIIQLGL